MEEENKIALNDKQERFCYEYCIDLNATQAAIRAGYSKKTASSIGAENLTKPNIKKRISEMQANLAATSGITALKIINEHAKIAFSNASKFRNGWMTMKEFEEISEEDKSCIQEVQTTKTKKFIGEMEIEEEYVKVKLYDKQKSLIELKDILGYNSTQKIEAAVEHKNAQTIIIQKTYETDSKTD